MDALQRAFSLPELLAVLAIISMLSALLYPALRKMRWQAREIVCAGNLRQLAMGTELYRGEHGGEFYGPIWPPLAVPGGGTQQEYCGDIHVFAINAISPYLSKLTLPNSAAAPSPARLPDYLFCPLAERQWAGPYRGGPKSTEYYYKTGYQYTANLQLSRNPRLVEGSYARRDATNPARAAVWSDMIRYCKTIKRFQYFHVLGPRPSDHRYLGGSRQESQGRVFMDGHYELRAGRAIDWTIAAKRCAGASYEGDTWSGGWYF